MRNSMTTSEQKAYAIGYSLATLLVIAGNVALAIWLYKKSKWIGLVALSVAKPLAGLAIVAVILVLDLLFMGICKLILWILDRH